MPASPPPLQHELAAVDRQLAAYNDHDLARFVAEYASDVQVFRPPAVEPVLDGRDAFARHYAANRFNRPALQAEVVNRMVAGRRVVDHEHIRGLAEDGGVVQAIVVYELDERGLIRRVWMY